MNRIIVVASIVLSPLFAFGAIKLEPIPDLRPPRPELPEAARPTSPVPWILGGLSIAGIAIAFAWPRRRSAPPPMPPYTIAQRELESLRADNSRATPAAVSSVVRRYVVAVSGLPGLGVTSEEVASALAIQAFCTVELKDAASRILRECDVAAFAPDAPAGGSPALVSRAEKLLADLETCRAAPALPP